MADLTVERLFSDPPLTGHLPVQTKFSPDGKYITYLQVGEDDRQLLDLWRYTIASGQAEKWIDGRDLMGSGQATAAEQAERERRRMFSSGITSYEWSPDAANVLLPVDGVAWLVRADTGKVVALTDEHTRQTDIRFSPSGRWISFVRDGDLHRLEIATGIEQSITAHAGVGITNGLAEFIAQEEMHRFHGYWWQPDESAIVFTRVDEAPVALSHQFEISADGFDVMPQRYPFAGAANADVRLARYQFDTGTTDWITYADAADDYLARVDFVANRLILQVQDRRQQHLKVKQVIGVETVTLWTETSTTWINLHDNLKAADNLQAADNDLVWTSQRDDLSNLYLYTDATLQPITRFSKANPGNVTSVVFASSAQILFTGWRDNPTEQHLYRVVPGDTDVTALTSVAGWHDVSVSRSGSHFLDRFTALDNSGEIRLCSVEGPKLVTLHTDDVSARDHPYAAYLGQHTQPTIGRIRAPHGHDLFYRLTQPAHPTGALVVYVYGGPGVQRVRNEWPALLLQLFASRGIGVLELDNRGSTNRGRAFESAIYRQLGEAEVQDQLLGVAMASTLEWVDRDRIGVFGHSYGGYMAVMCLAKAPQVFKAAVAVAPVSDWTLYDTHYTERYLGTPATNPDGYVQSSLFPYLKDLRGALLLMHGMADDNVLFTHTTRLMHALQSRQFAFDLMTYPGSKHALQEPHVSIHRFNQILDFFDRELCTI